MKEKLWEAPEPSTAGVSGFVLLTSNGRDLELRFDYDRDGSVFTIGIRFHTVRAHRYRAELYLQPWHITGVYDTLVVLQPSEWVKELRDAAAVDQRNAWVMQHFMITLDSAGCFEVVAESWEVMPEIRGSLSKLTATAS